MQERTRQDLKWGEQNHLDGTSIEFRGAALAAQFDTYEAAKEGTVTWQKILAEEVAEAFAEEDPHLLYKELVQVAAVTVAWLEAIARRNHWGEK
jgi:hypothetical protein